MERKDIRHGAWYSIENYPLPAFPNVTFQLDLSYGDDPVVYFSYFPTEGRTVSEHVKLNDLLPYISEVEQPQDRIGFNAQETMKQRDKRSTKQRKKLSKWFADRGLDFLTT